MSEDVKHTVSYWQHSDPATVFVNHDQGSGGQVCLMLIECCDDRHLQVVWQIVLSADLKHAWPSIMRERQHGSEVQVVSEHDVLVSDCPVHDVFVAGPWVADS